MGPKRERETQETRDRSVSRLPSRIWDFAALLGAVEAVERVAHHLDRLLEVGLGH